MLLLFNVIIIIIIIIIIICVNKSCHVALSGLKTLRCSAHPAEGHHVEGVPSTVELVKEVAVGAVRCVVHLQLTARAPVERIQKYILTLLWECVCLVAGWLNWPHLAQLESGWGWGCKPVVRWLIGPPQVKSATSTHTLRRALAC